MAAPIERWDPFREMMTMRSRLDQLIEGAMARPRGEWFAAIFDYPAVDMYEAEGAIKVDIPLPGVKPEEVELTISGKTMTVKGERRAKEEVKEENYYRHEMHYGAFTRSVTLPESAEIEKAEASFENGVLTVKFPKMVTQEPKKIEIKHKELKARQVG